MKTDKAGWTRKQKGMAIIHIHPKLKRGIVENSFGVRYDGKYFPNLRTAKLAAAHDMEEGRENE